MTPPNRLARQLASRAPGACWALVVVGGCFADVGAPEDEHEPAPGFALAASANSITVVAGPGRADPEHVAPPAPKLSIVTWHDARGAERTLQLHGYLYEYDFSFVGGSPDPAAVTTIAATDDAFGHPGFGYVVSHNTQNGNSPLGKANAPTSVETIVMSGAHHAIHRVELLYDRDQEPGGEGIAIPVVIEWFVATGRDQPVWSVTWKTAAAQNPNHIDFDRYRMDSRGPYGSLQFDGAPSRADGDAIGGVAWGDFGLAFTTTDAQLTLASPWTYDTPNEVAFTQAWTASRNAELGIVETRPGDREMGVPDRVVGRERGARSTAAYLDRRQCGPDDARSYAMPCVNGWPYQLMNFDWDPTSGKPPTEPTATTLMAWGTPYGWLGASSVDVFDGSTTVDGRGDRAYATFLALGPKCRFDAGGACRRDAGEVATTIRAVTALAAATITATEGTVVTAIPRGPGATDTRAIANGYDDRYAVHALIAAEDRVAFTFVPVAPVDRPIFVIEHYTAGLPTITVDGVSRSVNTGTAAAGAFVSLDGAHHELWVTLNETVTAATVIAIGP